MPHRGSTGQGITSSTGPAVTRGPSYPHNVSSDADGETGGVGSKYNLTINQWANKSNPRNQGPVRAASAVIEGGSIPVASASRRDTGVIR